MSDMNAQEVDLFRKMLAQLEALHSESVSLMKKSSDKPVSALKIKLANNILSNTSIVLGSSQPDFGFTSFDLDELATASDLCFVVAQYLDCAEKVRCENIRKTYNGTWNWVVNGAISNIVTYPPKGSR